MRLHPRPHKSWFFDEYSGYARTWLVIATWIVILGGVAYGSYCLYNFLANADTCSAPYHLVYTGQRLQLVGKVLMWVDQYSCVGN